MGTTVALDVAGDRLQGGDEAGLRIGLVNRFGLGRLSGQSGDRIISLCDSGLHQQIAPKEEQQVR
jgi:hypothetical protein